MQDPNDNLITIEIDGRPVRARNGAMIIEAADEANVFIPRFCYHRKLSIAANCRMCLVEVEGARKPLPACATPVTHGMKVYTRSPAAISAQKGTMEFLLINHPLDCPICDQGGECELQDVAMGYGEDVSRYTEAKRAVADKDIGPLIATEMTRCIHCTRCVRFGREIAGMPELGATGRGEHMEIGTFVEHSIQSELSGNVIDLCPVGALTAKPSRFSGRAWEMRQYPSIAAHDCVGSHVSLHVLHGEIKRVVPRDDESLNECWISDRDRFSYEGLRHEERLTTPMIREKGQWRACDWDEALRVTSEALLAAVPDHMAALASPSATTEEMYLLQKLMRGLGCHNLDHRIGQRDFSDQNQAPLFPWLGDSVANLRRSPFVFLLGSNLRMEQPILHHALRQAWLHGGRMLALMPRDFDYRFDLEQRWITDPEGMVHALAAIAGEVFAACGFTAGKSVAALVAGSECERETARAMAEALLSAGGNGHLLIGGWALRSPWFASLRALAGELAEATGLKLGYLPDGANSAGGWLAGMVPHRGAAGLCPPHEGRAVTELAATDLTTCLLLNVEPELDTPHAAQLLPRLKQAEFVACLTPFASERMRDYADVLLPIAAFGETSGTFINAEGRWQGFNGAVAPPGEARPGWKVLRVLGTLCDVEGFDYLDSSEVRDELKGLFAADLELSNAHAPVGHFELPPRLEGPRAVEYVPTYASDSLVRRAPSLQASPLGRAEFVIAPELARAHELEDGDLLLVRQDETSLSLPVRIDPGVPENCVFVPRGVPGIAQLADAFGPVELARVS